MAVNVTKGKTSMLNIPTIPSQLKFAVSSLARAAFLFRDVFVEAAEGKPIDDILADREQALRLAEKVIDHWCEHLGIEQDGQNHKDN